MICTSYTLSGLNTGCKNSIGGIEKIWLADFSLVKWVISNNIATMTSTSIDAFDNIYHFHKGNASMTSTLTVNDNSGSYFTTEIEMKILKMETVKRIEVMAMVMGQTSAVVKDNNGKYWAVGIKNALEGSAGTGETGSVASDPNQYTVTLSVDEAELPYEITDGNLIAELEDFDN